MMTMTRHARRSPLFFVATIAVACVLGSSTPVRAESFISPLIGYDFGGDATCPKISNCTDKKLNSGVSFGKMGTVLGFEEEFGYAKDFFGNAPGLSSSVLTLMSNFMLTPKFGRIRPYALVGTGLIKTHVEFTSSSLFTSNNNDFGWDIGGGLIVYLTPRVGLRGDIRHFHTFKDTDVLGITLSNPKLDFGRASGALVFAF